MYMPGTGAGCPDPAKNKPCLEANRNRFLVQEFSLSSQFFSPSAKVNRMNAHITLQPVLALLAGILILVRPKLLNYIVAIYLIVIGLVGLFALHL